MDNKGWTYVCPTLRYIGSLDIRMSSLDKHMSNLTMLFDLIIFNHLTNGSIKNLDTHMSRLDICMSIVHSNNACTELADVTVGRTGQIKLDLVEVGQIV